MGAHGSRSAVSVAKDVPNAEEVLRNFDISPPTAAVIGAGMAGVHVAYELAKIGFHVTVFEQRDAVAMGETQYSLPFVGVGILHPYIQSLRMTGQLLRGTLSFTCPDIISTDHAWNSFFSSAIQRWLWARRSSTLGAEEVMRLTDNLSRLSLTVVEDLCKTHESLRAHLWRRAVSVAELTDDGIETMPMPTADANPVMIDPVGWTRELATIVQDMYDVKFIFGEKLLEYKTYLRYSTEYASTLRFVREEGNESVYTNRHFDVVVLAAGAGTGPLTMESSQLPIIGLSGGCVALRESQSETKALEPLRRALSPSLDVVSLAPRSHLLAYRAPEEIVLQGLLSFDTTTPTRCGARTVLARMERYLRAKCHLDVPLLETREENPAKGEIRVARYVRAFTPDGVPFISNIGAAFNSFVCAGFGDHAPDLAPGSAKVLAKVVELEAHLMQREAAAHMTDRAGVAVPAARVGKAREELQLLLNGYLTPQLGQVLHAFTENPFTASRFGRVVEEEVRDASHVSLLRRFSDLETSLVRASEPLSHAMNRHAIQFARRDNMPDWVRTIIYYYFNDEEDDEDLMRSRRKYAEGLRRIQEQFERKEAPPSL